MRHVIVEPTREGLNVTEMISVFNPTDHAWTGRAAGTGAPVTLELALPPTATCLKAGGAFREGHVKVENGKLFCLMPLLPGGADFQVHYMIPAMDNDRAEVPLWAPAATSSLFVFLPQDGTVVTSGELKPVEAKPGAQLRADSRFYTAHRRMPATSFDSRSPASKRSRHRIPAWRLDRAAATRARGERHRVFQGRRRSRGRSARAPSSRSERPSSSSRARRRQEPRRERGRRSSSARREARHRRDVIRGARGRPVQGNRQPDDPPGRRP